MSDDVKDIPPALTAEQWTRGAFVRGSFVDGAYKMPGAQIALRTEGDSTRLIVAKDGATIVFEDVAEFAALIALANEALRRFDDPRAIRHEHMPALLAGSIIAGGIGSPADEFHELYEGLESYLPPLTKSDAR